VDTSANAATKEHRYYHIWPVQDSAMAAKLMHNVELAGKPVTATNLAYYPPIQSEKNCER
jgi:hypothetical protein